MRRVLVVGAGPAGAAIALLLVKRGIDVLLVEREHDFDRAFRGEVLMPGGVDALRQIGVWPQVARLPHAVVPTMELFVNHRRVVRADWKELAGDNVARAFNHSALIELLVNEAAATRRLDLRMGTALHALEVATTHVDVALRSASGHVTERADILIGADGRASTTRGLAGLKLERFEFPAEIAWLSFPTPETQRLDPRFQAFTGRHGFLVLYPSWNGYLRVGIHMRHGSADWSKHMMLERLSDIAGEPYASLARKHAAAIPDPVRLKVLVGRSPRWSGHRVLLFGDAAHPMAPVRAQGVNLALRDAIVAANHIVQVYVSGNDADLDAALARVQSEREPEVVAIQRLQRAAMELPLPMRSALLRTTLLPLLRRTGVMKRAMLRSELPFRHGTKEIRLVV
jgi:2-polyprenyl-6-methoxyphenol hydroxylase-like FAD-dependent oxidoreductase